MTDVPATERDSAGRFVKAEIEPTPIAADDTVHPMATLLFGWVDAKRTPTILLGVILLLSIVLVAADLSVLREAPVGMANLTGFFGAVGFLAVAIPVLAAWPLSRLLRRREDFYGEGDDTPVSAADEEAGT